MESKTEYLYGDSTPSPFKTDILSVLRDAVDFAVDVLTHEAAVAEAVEKAARASSRAESEIDGATKLAFALSGTLERAEIGDADSLPARCAGKIAETVRAILSAETEAERAVVSAATARASRTAVAARAACVKSLETLLLRRHLPDTTAAITLGQDGEGYAARLWGRTPYGLSWTLELDIPFAHAFAQPLRIDSFHERLEVHAPEAVGWMRKEVRIRPQRLERLYVVELSLDGASTAMKLRTTPSMAGPGFDLAFSGVPPRVELVRVPQSGPAPEAPYIVEGEDLAGLEALRESLVAALTELADHPRSLVEARLDETPVGQLEAPRVLVERLLADLGPAAEEIAKRSLVEGELVIKRLLDDNHREEVFVSKAELREKVLRALPQSLWSPFDPLRLWDDADPPSAARPVRAAAPPAADEAIRAPAPEPRNEAPPRVEAVWAKRPQPPGAGNRRSALGPESTGRWPAMQPAFQK